MSEEQFRQAIETACEVDVDPESITRVAERIQRGALTPRPVWKSWSLAGAVLLAFILWPTGDDPVQSSATAPPPQETPEPEDPIVAPPRETPELEEPDEIEETPIEPDTFPIKEVKRPPSLGKAAALLVAPELTAELKTLRALKGSDIVVRMGEFDAVQKVFAHYSIPHSIVNTLDERALKRARLVLVNCGRAPKKGHDFNPLQKYVTSGGWLATSDWGVRWVEGAAPKTLTRRKLDRVQPDEVVKIGIHTLFRWWCR